MGVTKGKPIARLDNVPHAFVMRWEPYDREGPEPPCISVGTLADGGWYVNHSQYGARRFTDKDAAWAAVRRLLGRHGGQWEQIPRTLVDPTATHPGLHHARYVVDAAIIGYRAAYRGEPPPPLDKLPLGKRECCSRYQGRAGHGVPCGP